MNKILCTIGSKFTPEAKIILQEIGEVDCLDLTQGDLEEKIKNYDIILVGLGLNITKKVIDNGKNLKVIATATTGLDHIDVKYAKEKGIEIISLRGENEFLNTITGTAELAFGLILDILRYMSLSFESVKNYEWNREKFRGFNLYGKTIGIVGLGRLGNWVARYSKAFNMRVISYDPLKEDDYFKEKGVEKVGFEELIEKSDIISIHIHLKEDTENMFDKSVFKKMRNTAFLINTSRGGIVNEKDLLEALELNKIAGYATDVLENELNFNEKFENNPLVEYSKKKNNLIIVPHIGGMTHESREATDIFISKKIKKYLKEN